MQLNHWCYVCDKLTPQFINTYDAVKDLKLYFGAYAVSCSVYTYIYVCVCVYYFLWYNGVRQSHMDVCE